MSIVPVEPTAEHQAFYEDLKSAIFRHERLPAVEMLAAASQLTGLLLALQDQVPREVAMDVLTSNLEVGNKEAVETMRRPS